MKKGSIFIMKKIYKIEDLDCAHCAAKIEQAISELDGVENAAVSFLSQKITLEVNEDKINEILQVSKNTELPKQEKQLFL